MTRPLATAENPGTVRAASADPRIPTGPRALRVGVWHGSWMAPRQQPLTSRDIAMLAGVSQTTVSRVLSGSPRVRDATRTRVLDALERTGYVPNNAARVMRTGSTGALGVVVARLTNPFYPQLLDALGDAVLTRGLSMSLWAADAGRELAALEAIRGGAVDGVLYTTATRNSLSLQAALRARAPVVLVNRTLTQVPCDMVSTDNRAGAALGARHLLDGGRHRIAVIGGPQETSTAREREAGCRAALADAGRPLDDGYCVRGEFSHAEGHAALLSLLDRPQPPDAVFCVNDVIALGALDAARSRGVRVPEDLWIVGFDDIEMASWEAFSLTTVRQPVAGMAATAVDYLLERIAGAAPAAFRHARLPAELVVRGSTSG